MNDFVENLSKIFALFLLQIFFSTWTYKPAVCDGLEQCPPDKKATFCIELEYSG